MDGITSPKIGRDADSGRMKTDIKHMLEETNPVALLI